MSTLNSFYADTLTRLRSFKHGELKQIAIGAGLPEGTVRKIYYGEVKDPRVSTIEALHGYLCAQTATNGAVTRRDLRPDDWQDIWPELATSEEANDA